MSTPLRIRIDVSGFGNLVGERLEAALYAADAAVGAVAMQTKLKWQTAITSNHKLSPHDRTAYASSIRIEQANQTLCRYTVIADFDRAEQIENGTPARDLKRMLQTSNKTRQFKNGKRYLVIPIRHNTPGNDAHARDMPKAIHDVALQMGSSRITGTGTRISASGHTVPQHAYQWDKPGDKFKAGKKTHLSIGALPAGLAPKLMPGHKTDPYAGMRRMDASSGKSKSSVYLTFRIMHEDSTGWIIPARPGLNIARDVAQGMQSEADRVVHDQITRALRLIGV